MKFPNRKYNNIENFSEDYYKSLKKSYSSINGKKLSEIIKILDKVYKEKNNKVLVCGNGGSAALANHFACDHQKILNETKILGPFIISLASNTALMTAISNDNKFQDIYKDQINQIGKNDVLITISSSGNSENIVRAIKLAKKKSMKTISLTGFSGSNQKK